MCREHDIVNETDDSKSGSVITKDEVCKLGKGDSAPAGAI
jgi:hypothetical protein